MKRLGMVIILVITVLFIYTLSERDVANIYDIKAKNIEGKEISLSKYKNKVMLIINVASKCGFTEQYKELVELDEKYSQKGLSVLGFPSNQFLTQEPGTEEEIQKFTSLVYGVKFDMFSKVDVNGDNTHQLYKYLKENSSRFQGTDTIKWNFTKFLVDRNGKVVQRYSSSTKPKDIENDIIKLLE